MITRRRAFRHLALTTGALALTHLRTDAQTPAPMEMAGVFKLPPLGYDYDALEPFIDAETMKLHHDKHHGAYVSKLNTAISAAPGLEKLPIEEILTHLENVPAAVRNDVRNQGGGHANHSFFWQTLKKNENGKPGGELMRDLEKTFGNFAKFQTAFNTAAAKVFGSGWAWLVWKSGRLSIESSANQDSPYSTGGVPVLGLDVWEHAYYLKYQNRRADYLQAFQNVIHWDFVSERYRKLAAG